MANDSPIRRVGILGTGVIGAGWAAHFLRSGFDVAAHDPAPGAEARLRDKIAEVWPLLERIGLADGADQARLTFSEDVAGAVAEADYVQESAPEREELKIGLIAEIDAAAPSHAIIASSTSGYAPTLLARDCVHPERVVVAHPFNPPYLVPLVEVVAGEKTDPAAIDRAIAFYRATGKRPLRCSTETPGFVGDRLMEALWREALHMLANDMATVEEIEAAICYGPGLRWALMGPLTVLHLAGGEAGIAHTLEQFGPALNSPWTFLEAPEMTDGLRDKLIGGCERLTEGHSLRALEQERDELLFQMLGMLNKSLLWNLADRRKAEVT